MSNYPYNNQQTGYPTSKTGQNMNYPMGTQQTSTTSYQHHNVPVANTVTSQRSANYPTSTQPVTNVQTTQQTHLRTVPVTSTTTTKQTYYIPPTTGQHITPTTTTTHHMGSTGMGMGTTGNMNYTRGQMYKWDNPYGLSIPVITFDPNCRKCHGSGVSTSRFSGTQIPCTRCYTRHGYCKKCYGTGINYRKNKACTRCQAGKLMKNKSSSSSDNN